jgi:hypothetical protein
LFQVFLSPADDFRMQISGCDLVAALEGTPRIAQWRHNMKQDDLAMKMPSQIRCLMSHLYRGIKKNDRDKNLAYIQRHHS